MASLSRRWVALLFVFAKEAILHKNTGVQSLCKNCFGGCVQGDACYLSEPPDALAEESCVKDGGVWCQGFLHAGASKDSAQRFPLRDTRCWSAGWDMVSRDASCAEGLVCARFGYDGRNYGSCVGKHCCSTAPVLEIGDPSCYFAGGDVVSRDAACRGDLVCARNGWDKRDFGNCIGKHCCSAKPSLALRYNETRSVLFLQYARVAFCAPEAIKAWACGDMCDATAIVQSSARVVGPGAASGVLGYVAQLPPSVRSTDHSLSGGDSSHQCVVAFRGSVNTRNWLTDMDAILSTWPERDQMRCPNCQVHAGFKSAYEELRHNLHYALQELNCKVIHVAGHSLGAAIATLACMDLRIDSESDAAPKCQEAWLFGSPRVGNKAFVDAFIRAAQRQRLEIPAWRVVDYHDPVPALDMTGIYGEPLFQHIPVQVYYTTPDGKKHSVCDASLANYTESTRCGLNTVPWRGLIRGLFHQDHTEYLGYTTRTRYLKPKCRVGPTRALAATWQTTPGTSSVLLEPATLPQTGRRFDVVFLAVASSVFAVVLFLGIVETAAVLLVAATCCGEEKWETSTASPTRCAGAEGHDAHSRNISIRRRSMLVVVCVLETQIGSLILSVVMWRNDFDWFGYAVMNDLRIAGFVVVGILRALVNLVVVKGFLSGDSTCIRRKLMYHRLLSDDKSMGQ